MTKADEFSRPVYRTGTWLRARVAPQGVFSANVYSYDQRGCAVGQIMVYGVTRVTNARGSARQRIFSCGWLVNDGLKRHGVRLRTL